MKRLITVLFFFGVLAWPAAAYAVQVKLPAQIGEPVASVKQRLGEPKDVYYDEMSNTNELNYKDRGYTITVFAQTGTVASVCVLGNYHDPAAGTYVGGVIDDLDMNATLDRYTEKLGQGENKKKTFITGSKSYDWTVDKYILRVNVWEEDHTESGVVHPKGSVLSIDMLDPSYDI